MKCDCCKGLLVPEEFWLFSAPLEPEAGACQGSIDMTTGYCRAFTADEVGTHRARSAQ